MQLAHAGLDPEGALRLQLLQAECEDGLRSCSDSNVMS